MFGLLAGAVWLGLTSLIPATVEGGSNIGGGAAVLVGTAVACVGAVVLAASIQPRETHIALMFIGMVAVGWALADALVRARRELPAPNWYPDPADPQQWRYWDGQTWTDHHAPA